MSGPTVLVVPPPELLDGARDVPQRACSARRLVRRRLPVALAVAVVIVAVLAVAAARMLVSSAHDLDDAHDRAASSGLGARSGR